MAGGLNRGAVCLFAFAPPDKRRPVVILTRQPSIEALGRVTVAPITSTVRGAPSEVVLGPEDGMRGFAKIGRRDAARGDPEVISASAARSASGTFERRRQAGGLSRSSAPRAPGSVRAARDGLLANPLKAPCAVNLHNVVTVPKSGIGPVVARLSERRMNEICEALGFALGCGPTC